MYFLSDGKFGLGILTNTLREQITHATNLNLQLVVQLETIIKLHKITQQSKSSHQYILNPIKENRNYINSYQVYTI